MREQRRGAGPEAALDGAPDRRRRHVGHQHGDDVGALGRLRRRRHLHAVGLGLRQLAPPGRSPTVTSKPLSAG
jgi:hypothetical protein